jgi:hypothetical protein
MLAVLYWALTAEMLVSKVVFVEEESSVDEASVLLSCSNVAFKLSFTRSPTLTCRVSFIDIGGDEAGHGSVLEDVEVGDHTYTGAVNQHQCIADGFSSTICFDDNAAARA